MGKVLVEKLLRTCPGIKKMYLLVRPKKDVKQKERIKSIIDGPLFELLRTNYPETISKIHIICGDCEQINLGLSDKDAELLRKTVTVVFHVAASVRFDDTLKKAVLMNARGTRDVISLAKEMKNLKVLVHISTSYCNTDKKVIDEIVYPPQADWRKIIKMAESMDDELLHIIQPKILDHFPNTYTFTKSLAENIVYEKCDQIPTVIFRPSIVISSYSDPIPGWVDNMNGPVGLILGVGLGIIRTMYCDEDVVADWVPVDVAISAVITSAWYQGCANELKKKECLVINACTSNTKPVSYKSVTTNSLKLTKIYPFNRVMWYPFVNMTTNNICYQLQVFLFHILPGLFLDALLKLKGEKLSLMRIYRKAYFANMALVYFMTNEWHFKNGQFMSLSKVMKEEDQETFQLDLSDRDPMVALKEALFGTKKFLLKESPHFERTLPKAKSKLRKLFILHCTLFTGVIVFVLFLFWSNHSFLHKQIIKFLKYKLILEMELIHQS
ncbi:fatty acyl-CoA reductase 1-like [Chrysoperla carnea]|uniref:fatty acyl-CoA reductase 1-like n=1 Tax=Chrysoperla carnea TaxID=189513 RepID=UPI001D078125|nr:fatty acyl-CoA reductase 1-like [Chrysoperla carnea]